MENKSHFVDQKPYRELEDLGAKSKKFEEQGNFAATWNFLILGKNWWGFFELETPWPIYFW